MIVNKPPMGWNSWNTFGNDISDELIRETADKMVDSGLKDAGYDYLVIDDCWSEHKRDSEGRLVPDKTKFPKGMKAISDYVHSKGLKFGMYTCAGNLTCAGYPGSYDHEFTDAQTFASWGVDFLKYDYCYHTLIVTAEERYRRMGMALANSGRDILYSACSWGIDGTPDWIKTTGAHMWRSGYDIFDSWGSIRDIIKHQFPMIKTNGHGCFNDMDMLVIGMNGVGNVKTNSTVTYEEYKTHFNAWAMLGSPLIIGCDIRNMSDETKSILMNREVIAINQDPAYRQVYKCGNDDVFPMMRMLDGGDLAIGFFNLSDTDSSITISLEELALSHASGANLSMRDLWTGEVSIFENEVFSVSLKPHESKLYRAKVILK